MSKDRIPLIQIQQFGPSRAADIAVTFKLIDIQASGRKPITIDGYNPIFKNEASGKSNGADNAYYSFFESHYSLDVIAIF